MQKIVQLPVGFRLSPPAPCSPLYGGCAEVVEALRRRICASHRSSIMAILPVEALWCSDPTRFTLYKL